MNASDPTRQMALVGKPVWASDFGQPRLTLPNKLDRTLQSEVHDVAMRGHADGSGDTRVKWNGLRPAISASASTPIGSSR